MIAILFLSILGFYQIAEIPLQVCITVFFVLGKNPISKSQGCFSVYYKHNLHFPKFTSIFVIDKLILYLF